MRKNRLPMHWLDDEVQHLSETRSFVDVSWRMELPGLPAPLLISRALSQLLFPEIDDLQEADCFCEPEVPCQETAERFAEAALVLATAIAATERQNPVSVELPVIEGVTLAKTYIKVFSFRDSWTEDGYLILLADEPDPSTLEFAELEADAFCLDEFRDWEDV